MMWTEYAVMDAFNAASALSEDELSKACAEIGDRIPQLGNFLKALQDVCKDTKMPDRAATTKSGRNQ